jgi:hypothetical protein
MKWKDLPRFNRAAVLTLPGAAIWSLPIGILGSVWVRPFFPGFLLPDWIFMVARIAVLILLPVSTVCSFIAMEAFAESKHHHGKAALLMMFNLITGILSGLGTVAALFAFL